MANLPINWTYMGEAMGLLLFPLGLTLGKKISWKGFTSSTAGNDFSCWSPWMTVPTLWLDVPRAYLGALLLSNPDFALPAVAAKDASVRNLAVLGLLGLAVLVQMFALRKREEDDEAVAAPISFLVGVLFALMSGSSHGLMVAVFATVVAMACASGVRSWHGFFLGGIIGLVLPGYLLLGELQPLLTPALLLFQPVILNLVFRREFVVPVRRTE